MSALGELFAEIELPESIEARERTISLLTRNLVVQPAPPAFRRRLAIGMAAVALLVFLAATPAGRSTVSWAAELIGIGDVGGPPTLEERPTAASPSGEQVVIGTGATPEGHPYEITAFGSQEVSTGAPTTCFFADLPKSRAGQGEASAGVCLENGELDAPVLIGSMAFPESDSPYLLGAASPGAETVTIGIEGREEEKAAVFDLDGGLLTRTGGTHPLKVFIGFLPSTLGDASEDPTAVATSYNADGTILGSDRAAGEGPALDGDAVISKGCGAFPDPESLPSACEGVLGAGR